MQRSSIKHQACCDLYIRREMPSSSSCIGLCLFGFCLFCSLTHHTQVGDLVCDPLCIDPRGNAQGNSCVNRGKKPLHCLKFVPVVALNTTSCLSSSLLQL